MPSKTSEHNYDYYIENPHDNADKLAAAGYENAVFKQAVFVRWYENAKELERCEIEIMDFLRKLRNNDRVIKQSIELEATCPGVNGWAICSYKIVSWTEADYDEAKNKQYQEEIERELNRNSFMSVSPFAVPFAIPRVDPSA